MGKMQLKHIPNDLVVELAAKWVMDPQNAPGVVKALVAMGVPEKLAVKKVEKLSDGVILEYGVSPYYAWPVIKPDYNEFEKYIEHMQHQEKELEIGQWSRMVIDYQRIHQAHITSIAKFDAAWEHLLEQPGMRGQVTDQPYGREWIFKREPYNNAPAPRPLNELWEGTGPITWPLS